MARTKNGRAPVRSWDPMQRVPMPNEARDSAGEQCWLNVKYQVFMTPMDGVMDFSGGVHLSIKRRDKQPLLDWRDLQRIKNELVGPEREAVQLFPGESRLVDEANQFHLWVLPEGRYAPFGYMDRMVGSPENAAKVGAKQREWDEEPEGIDTHDADFIRVIPGWQGDLVSEEVET